MYALDIFIDACQIPAATNPTCSIICSRIIISTNGTLIAPTVAINVKDNNLLKPCFSNLKPMGNFKKIDLQ
ncbi:hypothetical protein D3C85_1229850 [compost metagenome]